MPMKKLLIRILLFILPLILLAYPLDWLITSQLKQSQAFAYGKSAVWGDVFDGKVDSQCIILGSSRATQHVDPILLEQRTGVSTYNMGVDAHNVNMHIFRFNEIVKYNPQPRYVIFSVDAFTLEKRPDLYGKEQFLPYMLCNDEIEEMARDYIGFNWYDFHLPLIRYIGETKAFTDAANVALGRDKPILVKGYNAIDLQWQDDLAKAKKKMDVYHIEYDDKSVKMFEDFIGKCNENQISLALIYTPEYIEGQAFTHGRGEMIRLFDEMARKNNILFIDYSSDSLSFDKRYFHNSIHLNKTGSELFTGKLAKDLEKNDFFQK